MQDSEDLIDELPRSRLRKGIYVLPNLFTLAALFGGFYAIVMAMNNHFEVSAIAIFCSIVLDSLDGRVARMTNTQTEFGAQMDSLADMVSFEGLGSLGLVCGLCLLRLCCAALGSLQCEHHGGR